MQKSQEKKFKNKIIKLYKAKVNIKDIAKITGCSHTKISYWLAKWGVRLPPAGIKRLSQIGERCEQGHDLCDVLKEMNMTVRTLHYYLALLKSAKPDLVNLVSKHLPENITKRPTVVNTYVEQKREVHKYIKERRKTDKIRLENSKKAEKEKMALYKQYKQSISKAYEDPYIDHRSIAEEYNKKVAKVDIKYGL